MNGYNQVFTRTDDAYRATIERILNHGVDKSDRTGTGTRSVFGNLVEIDMSQDTLAVVSLKKTKWQDAINEMIWMLSGSNSLVPLLEKGIHIWTDWPMQAYLRETGEQVSRDEFEARILGDTAFAEKWGTIYPCYGTEMRAYQSSDGAVIDQMAQLVQAIKDNPNNRRLIWSLWRPEYVTIAGGTGLPPCHFQGSVNVSMNKDTGNIAISLAVSLRAHDIALGKPYNDCQYSYLLHLLSALTGYDVGTLQIYSMDCHLYSNHIEPLRAILDRESRPDPKFIWKRKPASLDDNLSIDDFDVVGYDPHPFIKLPVAV